MLSAAVAYQAENSIKGLKKLIRCSLLTDRHVKFYVSRKFRENFALLLLCCWTYFQSVIEKNKFALTSWSLSVCRRKVEEFSGKKSKIAMKFSWQKFNFLWKYPIKPTFQCLNQKFRLFSSKTVIFFILQGYIWS